MTPEERERYAQFGKARLLPEAFACPPGYKTWEEAVDAESKRVLRETDDAYDARVPCSFCGSCHPYREGCPS